MFYVLNINGVLIQEPMRELDPSYHQRKRIAKTLIRYLHVNVTVPKKVCDVLYWVMILFFCL